MAKKAAVENPFDAWLQKLSSNARSTIADVPVKPSAFRSGAEEEEYNYGMFVQDLSDKSREVVDEMVVEERSPEEDADPKAYQYGCVECANGEFPLTRLFKTPETLVRHIGKLGGEDISVIAFYGIVLPLSKGPSRYLRMPDSTTVMTVPNGGIGLVQRVDAELIDFEVQEDGFLGPPELADSSLSQELEIMRKSPGLNPKRSADDDDDDDEEGEEPAEKSVR